jgi:hypothetical protein
LRDSNAGFVDFTVNQECRYASGFGFFQRADGGVCAGVIKDDRFRFTGNRRFDQLVLFVNVIIMGSHEGGVAKFFGFCRRAVRFRFKEWVVV